MNRRITASRLESLRTGYGITDRGFRLLVDGALAVEHRPDPPIGAELQGKQRVETSF